MIVVSDTSPLCNLALINHLWLLEAIYQTVIIPTLVAEELAAANNPAVSFSKYSTILLWISSTVLTLVICCWLFVFFNQQPTLV